jgi:hypothetical protein
MKSAEPRWPIWSLLWRMLVFGPVLMPLGLLVLAAAFAALFAPWIFAIVLFLEDRYLPGALLLAVGAVSARFTSRFIGWLLRGIEYSSL